MDGWREGLREGGMIVSRGLHTHGRFSTILVKTDNFCDLPVSLAQLDVHLTGIRRLWVRPLPGQQHSFVELRP